MGRSKSSAFSTLDNDIANVAKALAHPARIAILRHLIENPSCVCGDIVDALPLSQSTVSQHLAELKKIGLIKGEITPPKVCYCIDADKWNELTPLFSVLFNHNVSSKNCC